MAICVVSMIRGGCYCDLPEAAVWCMCVGLWGSEIHPGQPVPDQDVFAVVMAAVTVCRLGDVSDVCLAAW